MNVRTITLCFMPALVYADSLVPQCPATLLIPDMTLAHSGCRAGNEVFSNTSVTLAGLVAGMSFSSLEIDLPSSSPGAVMPELNTAPNIDGGSGGASVYETINYDVTSLSDALFTGVGMGLAGAGKSGAAAGCM